jgi:CubicO group peptidase (beta-lactamase class C family)
MLAVEPVAAQGTKIAASREDELKKDPRVDELLKRWVSPGGPGAAVMVIQNHTRVHTGGYGLARLDPETPITHTTRFRLASLTKQFTGMAIAMLINEETDPKLKLKPGDRLADILKNQQAREVRISHLLYHTSGLREYGTLFRERGLIEDKVEFQSRSSKPTDKDDPTNKNVLSLLSGQTLFNYPPGRVWDYCNTGYVCLASIIDEKTGSYENYLKNKIFNKLSMTGTFLAGNPDPKTTTDLAQSYDFRSVGARKDIDYSPLNNIYGEDGIYSNLEDLFKWDQGLLYSSDQEPGKQPLVSDETLNLIFTPGKLNDGSSTGYGFGWAIGNNMVDHTGDWLGFRTYIRRYLKDQFTIIILANGGLDVVAVADAIDAIYYPLAEGQRLSDGARAKPAVRKSGKRSDTNR